jgi:hypothetical protein
MEMWTSDSGTIYPVRENLRPEVNTAWLADPQATYVLDAIKYNSWNG